MALEHAVDQAVLEGLLGGEEAVALHVVVHLLVGLAGVLRRRSRRCARAALRISRAWISMSVDWPSKPAEGWWIRIRLLGSAERLPFVPPASSSEPIDIATPTHIVVDVGLDEVHRVVDREARVDRCRRAS